MNGIARGRHRAGPAPVIRRRNSEKEGFEPSVACATHGFQPCSFGHSDTSPCCERPSPRRRYRYSARYSEREGFEPSEGKPLNGFRDRPIQPLWHLSFNDGHAAGTSLSLWIKTAAPGRALISPASRLSGRKEACSRFPPRRGDGLPFRSTRSAVPFYRHRSSIGREPRPPFHRPAARERFRTCHTPLLSSGPCRPG